MKACVYSVYGSPDVVTVVEVPTPEPKEDEVLIRVQAATVSTADWRIRSATFPTGFKTMGKLVFGWSKPRNKILGGEFTGVTVKVGARVSNFKVGDQVIGFSARMGAHAEFKVMKASAALVLRPVSMSIEQAAAFSFGGMTALHYLANIGRLQPGENILVIGAGGSVGSAAVQLAKHFGAKVTAVCSVAKSATVKALGADQTIDYKTEDFTQSGVKYDLILDTIGSTSFPLCRYVLTDNGRLLMVAAGANEFSWMIWTGLKRGKKALGGVTPEKATDLQKLIDLYQSGAYRPLIDRVYPMSDIVNAHRHVDNGHKSGSVVIKMVD